MSKIISATPEEQLLISAIMALYKGKRVSDILITSCNAYAAQCAHDIEEIKIPLPLPGRDEYSVHVERKRYRPGIGQVIRGIDVYSFGNGVFVTIFEANELRKPTKSVTNEFYEFITKRRVS